MFFFFLTPPWCFKWQETERSLLSPNWRWSWNVCSGDEIMFLKPYRYCSLWRAPAWNWSCLLESRVIRVKEERDRRWNSIGPEPAKQLQRSSFPWVSKLFLEGLFFVPYSWLPLHSLLMVTLPSRFSRQFSCPLSKDPLSYLGHRFPMETLWFQKKGYNVQRQFWSSELGRKDSAGLSGRSDCFTPHMMSIRHNPHNEWSSSLKCQ